jgi:hypothetical protein
VACAQPGDSLGEMLGNLQCRQQLCEDQHFVTAHQPVAAQIYQALQKLVVGTVRLAHVITHVRTSNNRVD